jgi:hypothetical protein
MLGNLKIRQTIVGYGYVTGYIVNTYIDVGNEHHECNILFCNVSNRTV